MVREMKPRIMGHILISLTIPVILTGIFLGCSTSRKPLVYSHLSFTQKQCTQCHLPEKSGDSNPDDGEYPVQADSSHWLVNARRLIAPPDRLCFKCHLYGNVKGGFPEKLWQHAPSAQGACTFCHDPHYSENPFMLRSQSSTICSSQCHLEGYMLKIKCRQESGECLDCHNAHLGTSPHMLKKEYHEVWVPPRKSRTESESAGVK